MTITHLGKTASNLAQYYRAYASHADPIGFFTGLADYINYVLETPELTPILEAAMKPKNREYKTLDELETRSIQELQSAENKLLKYVKKNKTPLTSIRSWFGGFSNLLETLDAYKSGRLSISGFRSDNLNNFLIDIGSSILKQGHQDQIREFIDSNHDFIFSNSLPLRRKQAALIRTKTKLELWGALAELLKFQKAYVAASNNKHLGEVLQEYEAKNYMESLDAVDIAVASEEINKILTTGRNVIFDTNLRYLKMVNFKHWGDRAQAHFMSEISKLNRENNISNNSPEFDSKESILTFSGKKIKISNSRDSNPHYLLSIIFNNPSKLWSYDEIAEEQSEEYAKDQWRKFYRAAYTVNEKVAMQTTIDDFLSYTKTSVQINTRYLK